jgi:hypothetical protein
MGMSLVDMYSLIDAIRSAYAGSHRHPWSFVISETRYREWQHMQSLWARGKPCIRAHLMRHKSQARMPQAIREDAREMRYRRLYRTSQLRTMRSPLQPTSKGWQV